MTTFAMIISITIIVLLAGQIVLLAVSLILSLREKREARRYYEEISEKYNKCDTKLLAHKNTTRKTIDDSIAGVFNIMNNRATYVDERFVRIEEKIEGMIDFPGVRKTEEE